jgi:hypothetical protein
MQCLHDLHRPTCRCRHALALDKLPCFGTAAVSHRLFPTHKPLAAGVCRIDILDSLCRQEIHPSLVFPEWVCGVTNQKKVTGVSREDATPDTQTTDSRNPSTPLALLCLFFGHTKALA